MAGECLVITMLLLFVILAFMKSRRKKWAAATLPLIVVPLANGASQTIMTGVFSYQPPFMLSAGIVAGALVASCTWIGFIAALVLQKRRARANYMLVTISFNILLSVILILDYYWVVYATVV